MQLALSGSGDKDAKGPLRLPPAVPGFNTPFYWAFTIIWTAMFLLALIGPAMGIYQRYSAPGNNSQLLLGSRAGFGVSPGDAAAIRFTIGSEAKKAGIRPGDRIVAIYGLPLPRHMPVTEQALAEHANDPAYIAMGNLLFGRDSSEVPLTLRDADGQQREVVVVTGEQHIDSAARRIGVSPRTLSFVDLLPVVSYPFLLWAAWVLHRRNARDAVSSILSLAVLLTMAAEQPSAMFLASIGIPRWLNVALFDLGNILLLAGILLFPHGRLSWRIAALLACLPFLMFLHGQTYQAFFVCFIIIAVLILLNCMRRTPPGDMLQQIRWALFGFAGYAVFRGISILGDLFKWSAGSFAQQMLIEIGAGVAFGVGTMVLVFGLLVALLKYRLYDADAIISRTVSVAIVTLVLSGGFAAVMEGIITSLQFVYPESETSQTMAAMAGAIFAASCIEPVRDRAKHWTERRFQMNLFLLRDDLPEIARDMRETASLGEMLDEILARVDRGVRAIRTAAIINGCVMRSRGLSIEDVEDWRVSHSAQDYKRDTCEPADKLFPIRVPLVPSSDAEEPLGYLLVGPRPDGTLPSREEQRTLRGVSEPIARAVRTVIKREAREQQVAELISDNARRIETLERLLADAQLPSGRRPRTA
jgi:hypothetical protein